jgi:hypothetical protein
VRIHAEMRRAGVTLLLLWEEYRAGQPDGYGYSRFCDLYCAATNRMEEGVDLDGRRRGRPEVGRSPPVG